MIFGNKYLLINASNNVFIQLRVNIGAAGIFSFVALAFGIRANYHSSPSTDGRPLKAF
jgi:hypothetical protein